MAPARRMSVAPRSRWLYRWVQVGWIGGWGCGGWHSLAHSVEAMRAGSPHGVSVMQCLS